MQTRRHALLGSPERQGASRWVVRKLSGRLKLEEWLASLVGACGGKELRDGFRVKCVVHL